MGRSQKVDSIDRIEQRLDEETAKIEAAKTPKHIERVLRQRSAPKEHAPTKHAIIKALIAAVLIMALPVFLYFRYFGALEGYLKSISEQDEPETSEEQPEERKEEKLSFGESPLVFYISGSDSRVSVADSKARSDVNILAVVNPTTSKILLVSIPRDYYVQLHGTTGLRDKLTHAGIYGIGMSKATIEDLLSVHIDETIKVGFDALETVVDAIGGIDLYSDQDLTTHNNKCHFSVGTQHVNGFCALGFSRERYAYSTGDRHRGENQEQVITKIIEKVATPAYLLKLPEILRAADGLFETSLTYSEILDIIKYQLWNGPSWTIESISLDGTGSMAPTYSMPGQSLYVMLPNDASVASAKQKIQDYLKTAAELESEANGASKDITEVTTE
ncbi:LCP family protein [Candidatus Saccharibacteria bacterium]|nr:LCP family protein [Candidatus Saccharibacteria bacterium]